MKDEVLEVAALVNRLRAEDTDLRVFGADGHEYRIGPTLSEAEILRFECEHSVTLPPDYRLWLQLVGDGSGLEGRWPIAGVGPGYGIYHLKDTVLDTTPGTPFEPALLPPNLQRVGASFETWSISLADDGQVAGVLNMGTQGCSYETYLVVIGGHYGTVWESWEGSQVWPSGFTFLQWMRDWAENALPRVIRERISDALEVGMTKAQAIAICGEDWKETPWGTNTRFLRFENFATTFEVDADDTIIRVLKHSV